MIPALAVPAPAQLQPAVQTAAVSGVPTETSLTARIPFYAVPSNGAAVEVYNNGRGGKPAYGGATKVAAPIIANHNFDMPEQDLQEAPIRVSPFTSAFMAQVMGQKPNGVTNDALVSLFFGNAPEQKPEGNTTPKPLLTQRISPAGLPAPNDPSGVLRLAPSLVRKTGVAGYLASFSRSDAYLSAPSEVAPTRLMA